MILWEYFWLKGIEVDWKKISTKMSSYTWKFEIKKWLGLIDKVIWAHISEQDEGNATKQVMKESGVNQWLWLDENTHIIYKDWDIQKKFWDWKLYLLK